MNILMIEDNDTDFEITRRAFKSSDANVDIAQAVDGEQAIDMLQRAAEEGPSHVPHLIFLDIHLAHQSGHEVLAAIKSHQRFKSIPIVMFSGSADAEDISRSYRLKANCYIAKPDTTEALLDLTEAVLTVWTPASRLVH